MYYTKSRIVPNFYKKHTTISSFIVRKYDARNANKSDKLMTAETLIYTHRN